MKNIIIRSLSGILLVALVVLCFFITPIYFQILFLAFALIGTYEFLVMIENKGVHPQYFLSLLLSALLFSAFSIMIWSMKVSFILFAIILVVLILFPIFSLYRKEENPATNIAISIFPSLWIALPLGIIGLWAFALEAIPIVFATFIIAWLFDTLAFCAGKLFGKHKLFERISPKKTWEGFIISLILTSLISSITFVSIPYFSSAHFDNVFIWMGYSVAICVFSLFGDLVESMIKRSCGVKDSGKIIPGHGGILDRFDSIFLAVPIGFILSYFI